ncbi:MAG: glycogen/starch/alpha-glucan phosphorylase, partial [Pseudomonadales bacterium]|nr:glycogen/starch/alpha-glucan phosphorylase [Pseudomonadales bacterium]
MNTVFEVPQEENLQHEEIRSGTSVHALKKSILDNLLYFQGRFPDAATDMDWYLALAYSVRDRLLKRWLHSEQAYKKEGSRTVCYLSAEFLIGPQLGNNLINMGMWNNVDSALAELGLELNHLLEIEEEPGLGNGGLGRLAACYMDSMATQKIPAIGYGIRYEFGIFNQEIVNGWQVEKTDKWLLNGNPWELHRHNITFDIQFGGRTEEYSDEHGLVRTRWIAGREVKGVAYDTPIVGYAVNNANLLRLWKAEAPEAFDLNAFNKGDHFGAVTQKMVAENLTKILYPNDNFENGKRLRLEQQYFLVSCSLQDMVRIYLDNHKSLYRFHEKYAAQLNDTHPALAIPELMRLLVDEH